MATRVTSMASETSTTTEGHPFSMGSMVTVSLSSGHSSEKFESPIVSIGEVLQEDCNETSAAVAPAVAPAPAPAAAPASDAVAASSPSSASVSESALSQPFGQFSNDHSAVGGSRAKDDDDLDIAPDQIVGEPPAQEPKSPTTQSVKGSTKSSRSSSEASARVVDWDGLENTEKKEPRDGITDESTALLLARLEQENKALEKNPKAGLVKAQHSRTKSRPPSIQHIKRLVKEGKDRTSICYSQLPTPPPMTELEFWAALVQDYPQTAQRLPTLTSNKIRQGIPAPLRGVVWMSIAGARDHVLEDEYDKLKGETSPYEGLIGKDIGRSFPGVEMFRDANGDGQQMLANVLKCFSLYDAKIGYCQGLGFVVGPLLMHMDDREAFCVLVRLMEHYDLRSCFLPDLSGLHLRIYQFQRLLAQYLPSLFSHLDKLQIEPLYLSQWFLSFFAVTCPLPMLLRIYDVLLAEGASETLMRVALSLMKRNQEKLLACSELEDALHLLLSRSLWDTYVCNANDLVNDFTGLTGLVTREKLQTLEANYKQAQRDGVSTKVENTPNLQAAASRFLGRLWAGSHNSVKVNLSPPLSTSSRPSSIVRRTPSKQSMASTLNSSESSFESISTAPTEYSPTDQTPSKAPTRRAKSTMSSKDKDLYGQIEDLLTALGDLQREHTQLASELQSEREEREEDHRIITTLLDQIKAVKPQLSIIREKTKLFTDESEADAGVDADDTHDNAETEFNAALSKAEERFSLTATRRSSIVETKHQLRDDVSRWKEKYEVDSSRCRDLTRQLNEEDRKQAQLKDELREARSRIQDFFHEKQRLEKIIQDLRNRNSDNRSSSSSGLREFKLGRTPSTRSQTSSPPQAKYNKRSSSLSTRAILSSTDNHKPVDDEALLLELVNSKTAEALAKQELEEVKAKMDALRRMLNGPTPSSVLGRPSTSDTNLARLRNSAVMAKNSLHRTIADVPKSPKLAPPATSSGGFFSGWGRRSTSTVVSAER